MVGHCVARVCAEKIGISSFRPESICASRGRQLGGSPVGHSGSSEPEFSAQPLGEDRWRNIVEAQQARRTVVAFRLKDFASSGTVQTVWKL